MFDLDFNLYETVPIETIIKRLDSKIRVTFDIEKQKRQLENTIANPPKKNEVFKILSGRQGFSSIATIQYIADREDIEKLYVSTFRIGKKQIDIIEEIGIEECTFITSDLNSKDSRKYDYFNYTKNICDRNGWKLIPANNHTKIILMKTKENYYVIETSSNLNENPKMEQYSFENDKGLYEFYESFFNSFEEKGS